MHLQTYRSAAEDNLRRFPAVQALEELLDNVVCDFHMHSLQCGASGIFGVGMAVWSADEGDGLGGQRGGHGGSGCRWLGELSSA